MTQEEKTILKHANAIKKFCERRNSIECCSCSFNKGIACAFKKSSPQFWELPQAEKGCE